MKREKESPDYCSQGGERGGEDTPTESDSSEEEEGGGDNSSSPVPTVHNPYVVWWHRRLGSPSAGANRNKIDRDWVVGRLALVSPPRAGNF
jgi:hypothetical protein